MEVLVFTGESSEMQHIHEMKTQETVSSDSIKYGLQLNKNEAADTVASTSIDSIRILENDDLTKTTPCGKKQQNVYVQVKAEEAIEKLEQARQRLIEAFKNETNGRTCLFPMEKEGCKTSIMEDKLMTATLRKHETEELAKTEQSNRMGSQYKDSDATCRLLKYYTNTGTQQNTLARPQSIPHIIDFTHERFNCIFTCDIIAQEFSNMKFEENRLKTFTNDIIPYAHPELADNLAASGFYYCFEDIKVLCAYCKGSLSTLEYLQSPMESHRKLFATCPFLINLKVGNVPRKMSNESLELSTQCTENSTDEAEVVCVAGDKPFSLFSRTSSSTINTIDTAENHEILKAPHSIDLQDVIAFDQQHRPGFPVSLVTAENACSKRVLENLDLLARNAMSIEEAKQFYSPMHEDQQAFSERIKGYENWNFDAVPHWTMAKAGFFRPEGNPGKDTVTCYWCGVSISYWSHVHNPWIEHARWSPRCIHLLVNRGADFVRRTHTVHPPYTLTNGENQSRKRTKVPVNHIEAYDKLHFPVLQLDGIKFNPFKITSLTYRFEVRDIKGRMDSHGVALLKDFNFTSEEIVTALQLHMRQTGTDFKNSMLLLDALWKQREQMEDTGLSLVEYHKTKIDYENKNRSRIDAAELDSSDWKLCKVCLDKPIAVVLLNCGHLCSCAKCAQAMKTCPICRAPILGTVEAIISD